MIAFKKCKKSVIATLLLFLVLPGKGQAQELKIENTTPVFSVSSNLLSDATTSMNLGVEFKTGKHFTLKLPVTYNPWEFHSKVSNWTNSDWKSKFILVQPELRYWFCEPFTGHFLGLHGHYAEYNIAGIGSDFMKNYRYEGNLYGAGITYGYQFYLSPRWNLEASIGAGFVNLNYDMYDCETCGKFIRQETQTRWVPTQAAISLIYIIK